MRTCINYHNWELVVNCWNFQKREYFYLLLALFPLDSVHFPDRLSVPYRNLLFSSFIFVYHDTGTVLETEYTQKYTSENTSAKLTAYQENC